jgi:hypothetical protein
VSAQPLKNWKAGAYAALAEYYKVEAEREGYEARVEKARRDCERAGVTFRYGGPSVESSDAAYACNCGAIVTYYFGAKLPETHVCAECREKSSAAAAEDAALEGRPGAAKPTPPPAEETPF